MPLLLSESSSVSD